jgi:four helix bundle suffix protein
MSAPDKMKSVESVRSDRSVGSYSPPEPPLARPAKKGIRPSGGYRRLRSFQATTIIYDATVTFCARFVDKHSRTTDQMVQAARSGRQNIAEGSRASATSSQTELRLVNIARASLDELLLDYEDYLRQRNLTQWRKDDPEARAVREVGKSEGQPPDAAAYAAWLAHTSPAVVANAVICLIHQANYLLDRQIAGLEREFIHKGGYSERLAAARMEERQKLPDAPDHSAAQPVPACPRCSKPMVLRTARKGEHAGARFWGCTAYPACKGTRPVDAGGSD